MKKFAPAALLAMAMALGSVSSAAFADDANTSVEVKAGKVLYDSNGHRIARIYSISRDGDPQCIIDGALYSVPKSTLSEQNGKITTSMSKHEIMH